MSKHLNKFKFNKITVGVMNNTVSSPPTETQCLLDDAVPLHLQQNVHLYMHYAGEHMTCFLFLWLHLKLLKGNINFKLNYYAHILCATHIYITIVISWNLSRSYKTEQEKNKNWIECSPPITPTRVQCPYTSNIYEMFFFLSISTLVE